MEFENGGGGAVLHMVGRVVADTAYLKLYNIKLLAGRNFFDRVGNEILINETYLHALGFQSPFEAIGRMIDRTYVIVGVVKDFHNNSLHSVIEPLTIANGKGNGIGVKFRKNSSSKDDFAHAVQEIEKVWRKIYPDVPFEYEFLSEKIKDDYKSENRLQRIVNAASILVALISCIGLYGLLPTKIVIDGNGLVRYRDSGSNNEDHLIEVIRLLKN